MPLQNLHYKNATSVLEIKSASIPRKALERWILRKWCQERTPTFSVYSPLSTVSSGQKSPRHLSVNLSTQSHLSFGRHYSDLNIHHSPISYVIQNFIAFDLLIWKKEKKRHQGEWKALVNSSAILDLFGDENRVKLICLVKISMW